MAEGTFVTAINCMDGRVQEPVIKWMKQRFEADYVDSITEPGPDRIMVSGPAYLQDSIKTRVDISVNGHGSRVVAVVAHHDCTGYPVSKDEHLAGLPTCTALIESWRFSVRILAIWLDENWQVEVISDSGG